MKTIKLILAYVALITMVGCTTNAPLINRTAPLINIDNNTIPVSAQ